jgi:hypothetical protein
MGSYIWEQGEDMWKLYLFRRRVTLQKVSERRKQVLSLWGQASKNREAN